MAMNDHAFGILLGLGIPACAMLVGSAILLAKTRTAPTFLQLIGAGGLANPRCTFRPP
jgi:threonine/homoserine/homoserine lactone efflux protein